MKNVRRLCLSINAFVVLFFGRTNTRPSRWWHGLRTPRERNALRPQKQEMLLRRILPLYHARLGLVGGGQVRTLGMALSVCLRSYAESMRLWKEAGTDARPPNTRRLAASLIQAESHAFSVMGEWEREFTGQKGLEGINANLFMCPCSLKAREVGRRL